MIGNGHVWGVGLTLLVAWGFFYLGFGTLRGHLAQDKVTLPVAEPQQPEPAPAAASSVAG